MRRQQPRMRQDEPERLHLLHRVHRRQREPSALRLLEIRGGVHLLHRRQLAGQRPNCPTATRPPVLHHLRLLESLLHPLGHRSPCSERLLRLQMPAGLLTSRLHHRTEREHNPVLLLGQHRLLYHRRLQCRWKISPWEASLAYRPHSQGTECLRGHLLHHQVAGPSHLRLLHATLRQHHLHCRRRRQVHHFHRRLLR